MRHDNHARARAILGAAWFAVAAMGACTSEQRERTAERAAERTGVQPERGPQPGPPPVKVDDVKEAPANYYDKKVTLAGEVDKLYSDRAFQLEGTEWAFDDNITVLLKEPTAANLGKLTRDEELIVTGTVRRFTVADIERDVGWDLSPEIEVELRERPVLVADSVRRVGQTERGRPDERAEQLQPMNTVAAIVTAKDPKTLSGQRVELTRERVQSVSGKGLWIGPGAASQVFVVPTIVPKDLAPGDMVRATGTLKEVPAGAQELWGLPADMAGQIKDATVYIEAATVEELPAEKDERRH